MRRFVPDILISVALLLLQTTLVKFLAIDTIVPDLVLLWIAVVAIRRGQIAATVAGFALGLVLDLLSGPDGMLGLAALSKTLAGFVAGYFFNENKVLVTLGSYRLLLLVAGISILHNILYFLILLQGSGISWSDSILSYGFPTTLYTVMVALIPMFAYARRKLS
jgi:rod shape-determining protein MreD